MKLYLPTFTRNGKTQMSKVWWVRFRCRGKDVRKSTGMRTKAAAACMVREIMERAELEAIGVAPKEVVAPPLETLLGEYVTDMKQRRLTQKHVDQVGAYLREVFAGIVTVSEATGPRLQAAFEGLRCSASNRDRRIKMVRSFFKWLHETSRWAGPDPTEGMKLGRESHEEKGTLSLDEIRQLIRCAPKDRAFCYLVAAFTGLRRKELAGLQWSDVNVDVLMVPAYRTKNRRKAVIPLTGELQLEFEARHGEGNVFPSVPRSDDFQEDMIRARLPLLDARGNKRTFHSLRVSLASNLAAAGVPLTVVQRIMRHSSPALTSNVYVKHTLTDQREALGAMLGVQDVVNPPQAS